MSAAWCPVEPHLYTMLADVIGGLHKCLLTTETSECRVSSQLRQTMLLNTDTVCLFTPRIRFFCHFLSKLSLATILFLPHPQIILWPHSDLTPSTPHVPRSLQRTIHPSITSSIFPFASSCWTPLVGFHFRPFFPFPIHFGSSSYLFSCIFSILPYHHRSSSQTALLVSLPLVPSFNFLHITPSSLLCSIFLIPTLSSVVSMLKHPKQKQSNLIPVGSSHGATLWDQCTWNLTSTQQSTILNKVQILKDLTDKDYKELEIGQVNRLEDRNPCSMLQR